MYQIVRRGIFGLDKDLLSLEKQFGQGWASARFRTTYALHCPVLVKSVVHLKALRGKLRAQTRKGCIHPRSFVHNHQDPESMACSRVPDLFERESARVRE